MFTTTGNIAKVSDLYMFLLVRAVESALILTVVRYFFDLFTFFCIITRTWGTDRFYMHCFNMKIYFFL